MCRVSQLNPYVFSQRTLVQWARVRFVSADSGLVWHYHTLSLLSNFCYQLLPSSLLLGPYLTTLLVVVLWGVEDVKRLFIKSAILPMVSVVCTGTDWLAKPSSYTAAANMMMDRPPQSPDLYTIWHKLEDKVNRSFAEPKKILWLGLHFLGAHELLGNTRTLKLKKKNQNTSNIFNSKPKKERRATSNLFCKC